MKKAILFLIFVLAIGIVYAHEQESFEAAKQIIDAKAECSSLTDEQLEAVGEYYMEQMHPGEAHELMDQMMGGEGSESLRQMHIQMARNIYCGEKSYGTMPMMNMMGSGGMMNMMSNFMGYGNNYGMMGYGGLWSLWGLFWLLIWLGILALIVWVVYKLISQGKEKGENAVEILKKRYAKGEITKKQFEEMKKDVGR